MPRTECHNLIDERLYSFRHEGLQHVAFERQLHACHPCHLRGIACCRKSELSAFDEAPARLHAFHSASLDPNAFDLAILDDVNATAVCAARIPPCNRIMTHGAAAPLQYGAADGKARIVEIEERNHAPHLFAVEKFTVDAVNAHRIAAPC